MEIVNLKPIIGSSSQAIKLDDGTYQVTTKGSRVDSKPTTTILSAEQFQDAFGDRIILERTPQKDTFKKST